VCYNDGVTGKFWNETWLILSDVHIPFHDKHLIKTVIKMLSENEFTGVVLLGDFHDFFRLSRHDKNEKRCYDLQDEFDDAKTILCQIRLALGDDGRIVYVLGNHEKRLRKYLCSDAGALVNLRCLEFTNLIGADENGVEVVNEIKLCPSFLLRHGTKCGKYPARGELASSLMSGMSGHAHKTDKAIMHGKDTVIEWYSLGHMANRPMLSEACLEFDDGLNWDQSFGIVRIRGDRYNIEIIRIDAQGFYSEYVGKYYLMG
jgi:predicted phosphodiesterase